MFILAQTLVSDPVHNFVAHWDDMVLGATVIGILSHAVNSFPPPSNKYGLWLLSTIQYIVGQRAQAIQTKSTTPPTP